MAEATVTFDLGVDSVAVVLDVEVPASAPLVGDVSGTFGDAHISGDVNQTGDVFIDAGLLTGIDAFHWQGNGFTVFFQNGGQADLHGKVKGKWGELGTGSLRSADTTGWVTGDRIAVAPTAVGVYVPSELVWSDWSMARPSNSPDVVLINGSVAKPEVANLSQSIVFENLARGFHFHDSAGVQNLSDVKFLNCGTSGVLASYPVHFHLLGDNSRGSVLERVVVEGGKNHAFVPHGSHGISFPGCVAYNTKGVAYWWDRPLGDPTNNSDDINWDDCLSLGSFNSPAAGESTRLAGFWLGAGTGNTCHRSVAVGVPGNATGGPRQRSGFHWPEQASKQPWGFDGAVAHNNVENGILVWQNAEEIVNPILNFVAYNHGYADIHHGAYSNRYHYDGAVLNSTGMRVRAKTPGQPGTPLIIENVHSAGPLVIGEHQSSSMLPTYYRTSSYPEVVYDEPSHGSFNIYEDLGLVPADFTFTDIAAESIIELYEAGVLEHRWASGVWS